MLPTPKPLEDMMALTKRWIAAPNDDGIRREILTLLETPEYRDMGGAGSAENYILRNRPFITAHKLKTYRENPFFAKLAYQDEVIMPFEDPEHFVIGQAIDDILTHGDDEFAKRYAVVDKRISDIPAAIAELQARIVEAQKDLKKDGERSATGIKAEAAAREKIARLEALQGQIQLTETTAGMVTRVAAEYRGRHYFPKRPTKQNVVFLMYGKYPFKMELDHLEVGSHFGDVKSTANIETFDPMKWGYDFTMGTYYLGLKELFNEKLPGYLYVLDKNKDWCRSGLFVFKVDTLENVQGQILETVNEFVNSQKTGIWPWRLDLRQEEDRLKFYQSKFYSHPDCQQFKDRMEPVFI
jgi:hypothetical protein